MPNHERSEDDSLTTAHIRNVKAVLHAGRKYAANWLEQAGREEGDVERQRRVRFAESDRKVFEEALLRLDNTSQALTQPPRDEKLHSADLPHAIDIFCSRTEEIQETLVTDVGRLIRMGLEKLERAIDFLIQVLGSDAIRTIKEKVQDLWAKTQTGEYTDETMKWIFSVKKTQALSSSTALKQESLETASNSLAELGAACKEKMTWAKGLAVAVGFGNTVLATLTIVSAPSAALFMASVYLLIYLLIIAGILLIARNYAGDSSLLHVVDGVREIVQGLLV